MTAKEMRLKRLFSRSEKLVIAAMDHGGFLGPQPGLENPIEACKQFAKADAVLMMPGMIERVAEQFTTWQSPPIITRLVWNSGHCYQWNNTDARHSKILSVAQALSRGADIVIASLVIHTASEAADAENIGLFSQFVQEARELGIPMIGELFPPTDDISADELHQVISIGCRAIAELGADMIKTYYTGDRFSEIVESTPIPIMVLGAEKTPTECDALQLAANGAAAGAGGIAFGRNLFQSSNPSGFIDAAHEVMNDGADIDQVVKKYGLE